MNILHLEYAGKTGGIEKLCKDIGNASRIDHQYFLFVHEGGSIYDEMKKDHLKVECLNLNYICLFNYLFISSQMSAKPYFIGSTGILPLW